jgi:hypothetical protein
MVSSIVPGAAGAGALGVDQRFQRTPANDAAAGAEQAPAQGDRVDVSGGASLALVRESVRAAVVQVQQALALGQDAQSMLVQIQNLVRDGGSQADLQATLSAFKQRVEAVIGQGGVLAAGQDVSVQAEPGAAPVSIAGVDLRLKQDPGFGDVIKVAADANVADPKLAQTAQRSLDALQEAMGKLLESARALDAHSGFLNAAQGAATPGVRADIDTDGARLMALQVRQGLEAAGAQSIANVEPQAVLALFRA